MTYNIVNLHKENKEEWLNFCNVHETAWVHHKGITCLDSDDNHSFMVKDDSNVVAIVSFNVEKHVIDSNTYLTATLFGLSNPQPIVNQKYIGNKQLKKINNYIYDNLDKKSRELNISRVAFNLNSDLYAKGNGFNCFNNLCRYDYLDVSLKSILIDLQNPIELLWSKLSKGHRSDLRKYIDSDCYNIEIFNHKNIDKKQFDLKELLLSIESFSEDHLEYLSNLFILGLAEVINLCESGKVKASALMLVDKDTVQYHEAKKFTDVQLPLHHILLWKAFIHYKSNNKKIIDLGVFSYSSTLFYINDEKKNDIAIFKRGFGGDIYPFYAGEKYFSTDYFYKIMEERIECYERTISLVRD